MLKKYDIEVLRLKRTLSYGSMIYVEVVDKYCGDLIRLNHLRSLYHLVGRKEAC